MTIIGQAATHRPPTPSRGSVLDEPVRPASPATIPGAAGVPRSRFLPTRRAFGLGALSPASSRSGRASNPAHPCSPLGLGRVAMALALIASPVAAEELSFAEDENGVVVTYHNELTWPNSAPQTYTFRSSRGAIVFRLTRTPNDSCVPMPCADLLEVVETPPGTVAVPPVVELPELGQTIVRVIEFQGM